MKKGLELPLPANIAAGLKDVSKRTDWNKAAPEQYALPTETWRELVARRQRHDEVWEKLVDGQVHEIDDLITYNLDIWQFARDAIQNCEGPELLRAFFKAIREVTVLDPTCGSGAFLFAALRILEPLYDACLDRMEAFLDELQQSGVKPDPKKYADFRKVLDQVKKHPSREYFILKSIIVNNLYGVDIMEEAVEIAKLRLFLKLAAQVERVEDVEPLPDVDFNIRAGNTLVGFATYDQVKEAVEGGQQTKMDLGGDMERIAEAAGLADTALKLFHEQQTEYENAIAPNAKTDLRARLSKLTDELDGYLARQYGVDTSKPQDYERWRVSHQPFHWFAEFYGIMASGGFDVIIGNPPYILYSADRVSYRLAPNQYHTFDAKNLYAFVYERSITIARRAAPVGLIVQLTALSSERLPSLQDLLSDRGTLVAIPFPRRPQSVFEGVEMPVAIILSLPSNARGFATSDVRRFYAEERAHALETTTLHEHCLRKDGHRIAKICSPLEGAIVVKLGSNCQGELGNLASTGSNWILYYQEACRYR